MPRARLPLAVLALAGAFAALLFLQPRPAAPARSGDPLRALGPNHTPAPAAAAITRSGETTIGQGSVEPDAPVDLNHLPPAPPAVFSAEKREEDRIEGLLTEEAYEAQLALSLALPPDPALAPQVSLLATGPVTGTTFAGPDITDCCGGSGFKMWPPDPDIAVGRNHILVAVNAAFAIYNKSGVKLGSTVNAATFWLGTDCGAIAISGGLMYDPFVAYDPGADRFIVGYDATRDSTSDSYWCIAVSQTGDPTGAWYRYSIPANTGRGDQWMDYPHIGVWHNALYTTGNYFSFSPGLFTAARVYAFDKAAMYAGGAARFVYVDDPRDANNFPVFTLQPAEASYTYPASGPAYLLAMSPIPCGGPCALNIFGMTPDFAGNGTTFSLLSHPAAFPFALPVDAPQAGSGDKVQANDARLLDAQWHTDGTIYAAHTVACNPGSGAVDCVRWYQVGGLPGAPALLQQATIAGDGQHRFFPDLAVDAQGNMAIAYSYSTSADYVGIRFTGRLAADPASETAADVTLKAGEAPYAGASSELPPYRWGDYTGMVVDPANPCRLWYVGEYAKNGVGLANWGTYVGELYFAASGPPPAVTPPPGTPMYLPLVTKEAYPFTCVN
jgi:hypothetical protein